MPKVPNITEAPNLFISFPNPFSMPVTICHTVTMKGWRIRNSLISLLLASISSNKVWWVLSPGTLVFIAEHIGLVATLATESNKTEFGLHKDPNRY